ncbi:ribbon-helix-helix domain-containing protein [Clostridium sp. MSJ-4]|uniref:Ribbon-helix-helix domain-containing protein n=1 Tax=Clostridium simiarum TaxID=2841506 RepID=A0ABS6EY93_9CLOT|nr:MULTISPECIES: CopG family transcriptional regulator [Clostridium]MBU5591184.1 ribbon-helix-helix domain-containing protein [Clostridium simiarum]
MGNNMIKISEEILNEVNNLAEKSGMSKEDFVNCLTKFYCTKDIIDSDCYYDSFIA